MQKLTTTTKQTTKLSVQQIMVSSMIQATSEELQKLIDEALEKNIALEIDESRSIDEIAETGETPVSEEADPDEYVRESNEEHAEVSDATSLDASYYSDDEVSDFDGQSKGDAYAALSNCGSESTMAETLKKQLSMFELSSRERFIAEYIIDSLDSDGYLRSSIADLVDNMDIQENFVSSEEEVEHVLVDIVQAYLDPAGLGARDLRECLLLQLDDKKSTNATQHAYTIINEAFDDFSARRFDKLKARYSLSDEEMAEVQKVILHLNPRPGGISADTGSYENTASHVRPDFIVTNEDGNLVVSLLNSPVSAVRVSQDYNEMLESIKKENSNSEDARKGRAMIEDSIRNANIFIKSLVQRRQTLIDVMKAIVSLQHDYFLSGKVDDLKPMTRERVAEVSAYDTSTVSRVCSSRFVQTDFGIFALKMLFTADTSGVSNAVIKTTLKELVDNEDKSCPLNDDQLVERLKAMGYTISRRTVVKYRDEFGIPKASMRRE